MTQPSFLRSFTFDNKETEHLFKIAKVNIPFLSKENELMQVGNTDASHFLKTRITETSITIDGFLIKENSKLNIYDTKDELVRLINSDEPKHLVFDMFPDRYFNAIYTGSQEYDGTDPNYTPVTLVFDVPDGLAHSINPSGYTNVYTTGTNLMLDSEYNNVGKYMKQWVRKLDEKYDGSNVVQGDFTNGIPIDFERPVGDDERWLNINPMTTRRLPELKKGDSVNFSIFAQVVSIDEDNERTFAGEIVLEEWDSKESKILKRHVVQIPKQASSTFAEYGSVVKIENEKTNALNINYGFRGKNLIKWSKPMLSLLPPLGDTVVEPIAGATLYSNSLDWGDYDYSGNPNLLPIFNYNSFTNSGNAQTVDNGTSIEFNSADGGSGTSIATIPAMLPNTSYTLSFKAILDISSTGILNNSFVGISYTPQGSAPIYTNIFRLNDMTAGEKHLYTHTITTGALTGAGSWRIRLYGSSDATVKLTVDYDIKVERGLTATPYQPNLLQKPWQVSKVALNKNLVTNNIPVSNSNYLIYTYLLDEFIKQGDNFTVRIHATKPATETFRLYMYKQDSGGATIANDHIGDMLPVEGLTDIWELKVPSYAWDDTGLSQKIRVYQGPNSEPGAVSISWGKVERGLVATPPIDFYKYRGLGTFPSNSPHDYSWSYDPSYYKAVTYVPSEEGVSDALIVQNNGTYRTYPNFTFKMNGENGLVALLKEDGSVLQFGNPEDVDGNIAKRTEVGLKEEFWGNTLNPNIVVNTGFKSIYPNMNSNPSTPNLVQGTLDMRKDANSVEPVFKGVGDIQVWHGATMMLPVAPPSNSDRTGQVSTHTRFTFNNYDKAQRGRIEFATFDELGEPIMTTIIRDSDRTSNEIVLECWYKGQKLLMKNMDRKTFSKTFYEINMDRRGNQLIWRLVQVRAVVNSPAGWSNVAIDKEYKFTWNLEEPDTSQVTNYGIWMMRYSDKYHVLMNIADCQVRWENTPYYTDIKNYFQDGDIVEIDTLNRKLFINGAENTALNVVGNQWEKFRLELGETLIQPIVSSWANMADVTATVRETWL